MKVCSRCKKKRRYKSFRTRTDKRSGLTYLNSTCRKCDAEVSHEYHQAMKDDPEYRKKNKLRARRNVQKNRDAINERNRKKRQTPEFKKYMRRYRNKNRDHINQVRKGASKRYAQRHPELMKERSKKFWESDSGIKLRLFGTAKVDAPKELIDLKRASLELKRTIKKINDSGQG